MAKSPFQLFQTPYIDTATLFILFKEYRNPRDLIARLVKQGELIRLKNGLFLIEEKLWQGEQKILPYEQIANILYGPSYVSLEWALSFYGMIPERVYTVTSMTLGKTKSFATPIGNFTYRYLREERYSIGVTQKTSPFTKDAFLIATPEKALADTVDCSCRGLSKEELLQDLIESKRIAKEHLLQLNKTLLAEIAKAYRSPNVENLLNILGTL